METKGLIMTIVGVTISVIIVAACLMPVLSDAVKTDDSYTNNGVYYVNTSVAEDVTITMNYDIDNNVRSWYIDDVLLEYTLPSGFTPTVVGADNYVFRTDGRSRGLGTSTGASDYTVTVTSSSVTSGTKVGDAPMIVASTSATDYVMRQSATSDVYLLNTSNIVACGYTDIRVGASDSASTVLSFTGNIRDGVQVNAYSPGYTGFVISDVAVNATPVSDHKDLYKFQSVTFNVTYNDGNDDYTTACTYNVIAVPASVTAERAVHFSPEQIAVFSAIPLLIIVAILLMAVSIINKGRE